MTDSKIIHELPTVKIGYNHIEEQMMEDGGIRLVILDVRDGEVFSLDVDLETHIEVFEFLETHQQVGSLAMLKKQGH